MEEKKLNVTAVFRKYARYGYDKTQMDIFEACDMARGATKSREDAAEMIAVYETLRALEFFDCAETAEAVREVYFKYPTKPLKMNEITWRVRRFAAESYMDERTVYRRLKSAKNLFLKFYKNGIKNIK